mgnify:CR=1 FL=1
MVHRKIRTQLNGPFSAVIAVLVFYALEAKSLWPRCMTGCVYSSLLIGYYDLPNTLGPVLYEDGSLFLERLRAEGFRGTPPHIFTFDANRSEPVHAMLTRQLERGVTV